MMMNKFVGVARSIPKFVDAKYAGSTPEVSQTCTLILAEGEAGKSFALAGLSALSPSSGSSGSDHNHCNDSLGPRSSSTKSSRSVSPPPGEVVDSSGSTTTQSSSQLLLPPPHRNRDYYGVYPLRGKVLNVRDAAVRHLESDEEIQNIAKVLGLPKPTVKEPKQAGTTYGKGKQPAPPLRYGRVLIVADQDTDGIHITGLILNLFHVLWPDLLKRTFTCSCDGSASSTAYESTFLSRLVLSGQPPLIEEFLPVPLVTSPRLSPSVSRGTTGFSTEVALSAFLNLDEHMIQIVVTEEGNEDDACSLALAFSRDRHEDRQRWLANFCPATHSTGDRKQVARQSIKDFVEKELLIFNVADNYRSMPSAMDGLKPSRRKALFAMLRLMQENEDTKREQLGSGRGGEDKISSSPLTVAQLAGYMTHCAGFHHGEMSACSSVISLAQDFVGSDNNLPLLGGSVEGCEGSERKSIGREFGTRLNGGKDSAFSRYLKVEPNENIISSIFFPLSPLTKTLSDCSDNRSEGDSLLPLGDDGSRLVEPLNYWPVIPLVLVNGSSGIGMGFSSQIPNFHPLEVIASLRRRLLQLKPNSTKSGSATMDDCVTTPWYKGFKGTIRRTVLSRDDKFTTTGCVEVRDLQSGTVTISELPVGVWIQAYKSQVLDKLVDKKEILAYYENHSIDLDLISFEVIFDPTNLKKTLNLSSQETTGDGQYRSSSFISPSLDPLIEKLQLTSTLSTSNLVALDRNGQIRKFSSPESLLDEFYHARLEVYHQRKAHLHEKIKSKILQLEDSIKFVTQTISGELNLARESATAAATPDDDDAKEDTTLEAILQRKGFQPFPCTHGQSLPSSSYSYLLDLKVWELSAHKIDTLTAAKTLLEKELEDFVTKDARELWLEDLSVVEKAIKEYYNYPNPDE